MELHTPLDPNVRTNDLAHRPLVLVENEVTVGGRYDHWQDVTGERYQFPNQYKNKIVSGRPFVYYRGVRRPNNLRGPAEYFGCGIIGPAYLDPTNDPLGPRNRWKWICEIEDYQPFLDPVPAKEGGVFLEKIHSNHWANPRDLPWSTYSEILRRASLPPIYREFSPSELHLPPLHEIEPATGSSLLVPQRNRIISENLPHGSQGERRSRYSTALGRRGEEIALRYLNRRLTEDQKRTLRWVSNEGRRPGWDIEYKSDRGLMALEVKATAGPTFPSVELTANEWNAAKSRTDLYSLVLVSQVKTIIPSVELIANPAGGVLRDAFGIEPSTWRLERR